MVSLKSFKLINEGERDETTEDGEISPIARRAQHLNQQSHEEQPFQVSTPSAQEIIGQQQHQVSRQNGSSSASIINKRAIENNDNNNEGYNRNYDNISESTNKIMPANNSDSSSSSSSRLQQDNEILSRNSRRSSNQQAKQPVVVEANTTNNNKSIVKVKLPNNDISNANVNNQDATDLAAGNGKSVSPSTSSISIVVVQHDNISGTRTNNGLSSDDDYTEDGTSNDQSLGELDDATEPRDNNLKATRARPTMVQVPVPAIATANDNFFNVSTIKSKSNNMHLYSPETKAAEGARLPIPGSGLSVPIGGEHFEIVWSNLSYRIEPKWYKKINLLDKAFSHFLPGQTIDSHSSATSTASSSAGMNDNQHQMHTSANADSHLQNNANLRQKSLDPIEIFTNLNGTIKSGQMTAVLGPSGAGKTTLLNCLTGKLRKGVSGHINLIGANGKHLKMCTIPQKDHLLELLTVEENLWFASKIKNPEYGFDHVKNIERVIDLLGLKRCRSAKIKKISGGQHKRVSIAQELLSNPDILVLDEPTSGLDSLTCFKTISMLRDLVELSASNDFMKPMAIIVTIHQPQPKVFNLFHHVYILANGGRVIYEGAPELSLDTITSVTGLQPVDGSKSTSLTPGVVDPASFLIEIASEEYGIEPIKTLNDYQRRVFFDTNHANSNQQQQYHHHNHQDHAARHMQNFHHDHLNMNSKDNQGFSPDFDDNVQTKELSAIFVPNQMYTNKQQQPTKDSNKSNGDINEKQHGNNNVISEEVDSQKSAKIKRRKKSTYSLESGFSSKSADTSHSIGAGSTDGSLYMSEQLLYTREANHKGRFWSHTATLTHRTLLTIRRDPLLMTSRVLFHLMIPILMGHVYGKATGAANACPHYEPEIDITQIPSLVEGKRIEYMLEELHMSIENVSMFFIIMYAFAAAVLALNALSFPLNMQVLLKETRNGWYSMSSYVLAKTLADLPLELTMPCLTMALVYPLTGQPSSYLQWRMLTICLIMTLCSLIAQTQALILGALVMNSVQTAVFVSQASQLPWVILAGFTIRIKRLSEPLKLISLTSFYRLGCEAITLTRYGFGICPCDPKEITGEPVRLVGIPDQLRTLAQYWIDSMEANKASNNDTARSDSGDGLEEISSSSLVVTTTTQSPEPIINSTLHKTDIFQHLANQLSYANSYGVNITSCADVAPDRIRAINLGDNWLVARIWHLFIMLIIMKILLYYAVKFSIGIRL